MRCFALVLLLVGLAAAQPQFGYFQDQFKQISAQAHQLGEQFKGKAQEVGQQLGEKFQKGKEQFDKFLDQAMVNADKWKQQLVQAGEGLKEKIEGRVPQTRRIAIPSGIKSFLNKVKDNAKQIGDKIGEDLKTYRTQLKEAGDLIKQQWQKNPSDVMNNIQNSLNIAKTFGQEVAEQVKADIKEYATDVQKSIQ